MQSLTHCPQQTQHIDTMSANYGGTEMRSALQQAFSLRKSNIPTSVFVLTDGEVSVGLCHLKKYFLLITRSR